jgi:hypothetical protein
VVEHQKINKQKFMLGPLKTVIHGCVIIDGAPHENKKNNSGKGADNK